jgi:hypothetical protein
MDLALAMAMAMDLSMAMALAMDLALAMALALAMVMALVLTQFVQPAAVHINNNHSNTWNTTKFKLSIIGI